MKMSAFVSKHKIKIESALVDDNPNMESDHPMNHYKVTLRGRFDGKPLIGVRGKRRQMTTYFSMGLALSREPEAADVLDCLAMDSGAIENARSFEDWAGEFGYDTDSRKAEKTYKVCQRQAERLKKFLGEDAYSNLLWNVERL